MLSKYLNKYFYIFLIVLFTTIELYSQTPVMIGEKAPSFKAMTTQGEINFPFDYLGKWVVLFSHPGDFTPVCTSEVMRFASMQKQFNEINCSLLGLSVDGVNSHINWLHDMESIEFDDMKNIKIDFPIISDIQLEISKLFGMIHPSANSTKTIRGVFVIDDQQEIKAIIYYPLEVGRDIAEILRLVKALQKAESDKVAIPEGWQPGDDVFMLPLKNKDEAIERFDKIVSKYFCPTWYMCIIPGTK